MTPWSIRQRCHAATRAALAAFSDLDPSEKRTLTGVLTLLVYENEDGTNTADIGTLPDGWTMSDAGHALWSAGVREKEARKVKP